MLRGAAFYAAVLGVALAYGIITQTNYDGIWLVIMAMGAIVAVSKMRRGRARQVMAEVALAGIFAVIGVGASWLAGL